MPAAPKELMETKRLDFDGGLVFIENPFGRLKNA